MVIEAWDELLQVMDLIELLDVWRRKSSILQNAVGHPQFLGDECVVAKFQRFALPGKVRQLAACDSFGDALLSNKVKCQHI